MSCIIKSINNVCFKTSVCKNPDQSNLLVMNLQNFDTNSPRMCYHIDRGKNENKKFK